LASVENIGAVGCVQKRHTAYLLLGLRLICDIVQASVSKSLAKPREKKMKLWILERIKGGPRIGNDECVAFVVRAKTEEDARALSSANATDKSEKIWLNDKQSSCEVLKEQGVAGVVLCDFNAG
jgi:hypothetical protein